MNTISLVVMPGTLIASIMFSLTLSVSTNKFNYEIMKTIVNRNYCFLDLVLEIAIESKLVQGAFSGCISWALGGIVFLGLSHSPGFLQGAFFPVIIWGIPVIIWGIAVYLLNVLDILE